MKKLLIPCIIASLAIISIPTTASAGVDKGQKIFKKKFRKYCRFSGVKFSRHHTQDEWEELYDNNEYQEETKKICPRLKLNKIKDSWWDDVYEFSYKYASDGVIPKC